MSKKGKRVLLGSTAPYGVGVYVDAKARIKHQILMEDYQELQREVDVIRSKLEAGKQRKMILAAEVRFLRKRYESMHSSQKQKLVQPSNLLKQSKHTKELSRKVPESKPKKRRSVGKGDMQNGSTMISNLNHIGRIPISRTPAWNTTPVLDMNQKGRLQPNDTTLNRDSGKETSLRNRAHIFDLNEISTGDEDFQSNSEALKYEDVKNSSMRAPNNEVQNDLKLSICRNIGEGLSRVGKRKISWQDPVALRV